MKYFFITTLIFNLYVNNLMASILQERSIKYLENDDESNMVSESKPKPSKPNNTSTLNDKEIDAKVAKYYQKKQQQDKNDNKLDTIFVTGKQNESFNSYFVISQEKIKQSQAVSLVDLLKTVSGINISQKGGFGQPATINLNGSLPYHVVILVDGVKLSDSSTTQPFSDIGQIPLDFIEEIEITKGPSSVLYGSGAVAGVINIKTKKSKSTSLSLNSEKGSFQSSKNQIGGSFNYKNLNIQAYGSKINSRSISTVNDIDNLSALDHYLEKDPYKITDYNIKGTYNFSENNFLEIFYKDTSAYVNYDGIDFTSNLPIDENGDFTELEHSLYYLKAHFDVLNGFNNEIIFSQNKSIRDYTSPYGLTYGYKSQDYLTQYKASYNFDSIKLKGGIDLFNQEILSKEENYINNHSIFDIDTYASSQEYLSDDISLEQGIRINKNQKTDQFQDTKIDSNYAYNFAIMKDLSYLDTSIKLNYGQSFRLPSGYELFSGYAGNENLKSEVSRGVNLEIINNNFAKNFPNLYLNFFYQNVDSLISYLDDKYVNTNSYLSYGFETATSFNLLFLEISPSYTYNFTKNSDSKGISPQIPRNKATITTSFKIKHLDVSIYSTFADKTIDKSSNIPITLGGYGVHDVVLTYKFSNNINAYSRINNIFNKEYYNSYRYQTLPRSYYFGMNINL